MSKNLTRKGLALGAIVALGGSLLTAAPAFAADELTLAPFTGTAYKTIEGETFKLLTGLAPATPAGNVVQLKYQVVSAATATGAVNEATPSAATTAVTAGQPTNTIVYKQATTPTVGATQSFTVAVTSAIASGTPATAAVTAFFDANSNDLLDSGEWASATRTVSFLDAADVAATVTFSKVSVGDTTFTASAVLTDINVAQLTASSYGIAFRNNDAGKTDITNLANSGVVATLQTDGSIKATSAALTSGAVAAGGSYRADVIYAKTGLDVTGTITTAQVVGTGATIDAVARTIATIDATAAAATGVAAGAATQATTSTAGALAVAAKTNATYTITGTVKDSATTPAVVANAEGTAVLAVATGAALSSTRKVTVNGTTVAAALTSSNNSFAVTSNAEGKFDLAVSSVGLVATDVLTFTIKIQNITNVVTVTYADSTYSIIDLADVAGSAGRTIVKGAAYKLDYKVLDQFGDAPAAANTAYRLVNTVTGGNAGTYYATLAADGTASFSFTNNSTAAATSANSIAVASSTDSFANSTTVLAGATVTTVVVVATAAEATAKTIAFGTVTKGAGQASLGTITGTGPAAATFSGTGTLASTDFVAYEGRTAKTSAPALAKGYSTAPTHTAGAWTAGVAGTTAGDAKISIPVIVKDSTLAATAVDGASVTVAGKGMMFVVTDAVTTKVTYGVDSLTFLANAAGSTVDVYSHVTGEQSIVFTSGAATATQKITFANYGTEVAAVAVGTLPAQAQSGSTLGLSAVATDKWGNVVANVQVAFNNTGVGYVQDTAAQVTDSKGAVAGRLIVLQNDLGTSYITATAAKAKTLLSADLASAKSVEFGLVDADVVAGGRRVFVNAEFAKGRTITVTVDGKRIYSKVQTTDNAVELAFTQKKKGAHTVTVRVSGGIVFTEKVTTN